MNRGDRHQHDDNEPHRRGTDKQADDHGETAEELGKRGEYRERRRNSERLLEVTDEPAKPGPTEPAEHFLAAVSKEDNSQDDPHNEKGRGGEGTEEHVHGLLTLIR